MDYYKDTAFEYYSHAMKEWGTKIPHIKFPSHWLVQILPPFGGAVVRFSACTREEWLSVSVYLDCYNNLGAYNGPYWEIHPGTKDDIERFAMNDVDGLLNAINKVLE